VHNLALTVNGVHLLETSSSSRSPRPRAWEFALVVQPLKIKGATGSTVAPTALR